MIKSLEKQFLDCSRESPIFHYWLTPLMVFLTVIGMLFFSAWSDSENLGQAFKLVLPFLHSPSRDIIFMSDQRLE